MNIIGERLWIECGDGAARAHRAVPVEKPCLAVIDGRRQRAVGIRLVGPHGAAPVLVPQGDLVPAEPLTDTEEREYNRLDCQLAGTIGETRALKRFNSLRLRSLMFGGAA